MWFSTDLFYHSERRECGPLRERHIVVSYGLDVFMWPWRWFKEEWSRIYFPTLCQVTYGLC